MEQNRFGNSCMHSLNILLSHEYVISCWSSCIKEHLIVIQPLLVMWQLRVCWGQSEWFVLPWRQSTWQCPSLFTFWWMSRCLSDSQRSHTSMWQLCCVKVHSRLHGFKVTMYFNEDRSWAMMKSEKETRRGRRCERKRGRNEVFGHSGHDGWNKVSHCVLGPSLSGATELTTAPAGRPNVILPSN